MTLRKLCFAFLTLAVLVVAPGCDGDNGDGTSDSQLFVGTHAAVGVSDGTGDQTAAFAGAVSRFVVTFSNNGTYGIDVAFTDARPPIAFSGATYSVDEANNTVTIVIPAAATGTTDIPLTFSYTFSNNNNTVALVNNSQTNVVFINVLFGTTYTPPVTITLQRQ